MIERKAGILTVAGKPTLKQNLGPKIRSLVAEEAGLTSLPK